MNEKEANNALALIMAFFTLDPTKMKMSDQFYYLSVMMKFAEMIEPIVKEYGGSIEDIQKQFDKQQNERQFKDIASAILLKAMMDNTNKDEEVKDTKDET